MRRTDPGEDLHVAVQIFINNLPQLPLNQQFTLANRSKNP
jgi:hypothetical protein